MRRSQRRGPDAWVVAIAGIMLLLAGAGLCVIGLRAGHLELVQVDHHSWRKLLAIASGVGLGVSGLALMWRSPGLGLRRHVTAARVMPLLVALAVYGGAYALTWRDIPPRGDEPHYMLEAYSLAIDRDRNLAADYQNPVRIAPMFGSLVPDAHTFNYSGDPSVAISMHSVGVPLLLLPAAAVSADVRLMRIEMILISAAAAYLLLSILRRIAGRSNGLVYATWVAFAFSLPLVTYSTQIYPEVPAVFLLLLAVRLLLQGRIELWGTTMAATAGALLPWLHIRFAYFSVALAVALLLTAKRDSPGTRLTSRGRASRGLSILGPFFASAILLALSNQHWYGSPWPNAQFRLYEQPPKFNLAWAYTHSIGGVFEPVFGWLPFAPLHVLAFVGLVYFSWRKARWALLGGTVAVVYLLLVASAVGIQVGFAFPARLQLILIPLGAVPVLLLLKESRAFAALAFPLGALTILITIVGLVHLDVLVYSRDVNVPSVPVVSELARVWPGVAGGTGDQPYRDWPKVLAWVLGIAVAGSLPALWPRRPRAKSI
jgi:hypothetical protein